MVCVYRCPIVETLLGKGRQVRVYDPHIQLDSIYGSNRNFLMNAIPHIGRLMEPTLEGLAGWAEHLVVTQNPGAKVSAVIAQSGLPVLDLVGGMAGGVAVPAISEPSSASRKSPGLPRVSMRTPAA